MKIRLNNMEIKYKIILYIVECYSNINLRYMILIMMKGVCRGNLILDNK